MVPTDPVLWEWIWERGVPALLCIGTIVACIVFAKKAR